jgi:hypothetical protein
MLDLDVDGINLIFWIGTKINKKFRNIQKKRKVSHLHHLFFSKKSRLFLNYILSIHFNKDDFFLLNFSANKIDFFK